MVEVEGVTVMDVSVAAVTVRLAIPETPLSVAVIVVEPLATPVASPELAIVAAAVLEEIQDTEFVRDCVEPSV
jgi:hypothetical protein